MARYTKYLELIRNVDDAVEKHKKLLEGKVTRENLEMMEKLLCLAEKAWKVCWIVDRMDDIEEGTKEISEKGEGPDPKSGRSGGSGGDFRGGYQDSGFETAARRGHPTRAGASPWGAYGMTEGGEEARRGRSRRTGRFVHRAELEQDSMRDLGPDLPMMVEDAVRGFMDGLRPENYGLGFFGDPHKHLWSRREDAAHGDMGGGGATTGGVQAPVQNAGQNGQTNGNTGAGKPAGAN